MFDSCTWDDDYNLGVVQTIRQQLVQLATPADGYTAVLLQGSGSYAVEAVLGSVIGEQGKVLIVSNGAYGARMIEMAQLMGIACHPYDCGEVSRPDAAAIEQILQNDPAITHIAMVHSETTTGMLNPIEEVAELAKRYDKRYIVDAMSSFGGIPLDIAALNIDYPDKLRQQMHSGRTGLCLRDCPRSGAGRLQRPFALAITGSVRPVALHGR